MPYRRRPANARRTRRPAPVRRRRATYKKKRGGSLSVGRIPRGLASAPFPTTMYRVLTYTDDCEQLVQQVVNSPSYVEYRGNSLFDPDLTGAGSQPRYFDTLCGNTNTAAPYRNYNVLASKIIIDIYQDPALASGSQPMTAFVLPNRGTTALENLPDDQVELSELPYIKKKEIGLNTWGKPFRLTHYAKSKTMFGEKDGTGTDYQASYNASPALGWKWSFGICNIIPTTLVSCYYKVTIKYYVQFTLLNEVARS